MGFVDSLLKLLPLLAAIVTTALTLWIAHWLLLRRRGELSGERRAVRQLVMLVLTGLGLVLVTLTLPVPDTNRNQLLALLGLALTAVIALSSTSFVSNAMAGLMLRSVKCFRPGDFIRVEGRFGRVSERGLFHTEIQTEDRDLTTLPNIFLITHPVTVVRSSGTIVTATVSLGYDEPRTRVEPSLTRA
ncbi:MAG: mechanosensitive ion channel domain-containing protein, partial [Planctomycetota bacterium]